MASTMIEKLQYSSNIFFTVSLTSKSSSAAPTLSLGETGLEFSLEEVLLGAGEGFPLEEAKGGPNEGPALPAGSLKPGGGSWA